MVDIGLLVFVTTVIVNVAALVIDFMLMSSGVSTLTSIAQGHVGWAILFVTVQVGGTVGLGTHLFYT